MKRRDMCTETERMGERREFVNKRIKGNREDRTEPRKMYVEGGRQKGERCDREELAEKRKDNKGLKLSS